MPFRIDTERTKSLYKSQLGSFMNCFIMTCSPFEERQDDLEREAEERKLVTGWSWIEKTAGFCSYRKIVDISHQQIPSLRPYLDIHLDPFFGVLTSNRFKWNCYPCFKGVEFLSREYGEATRTMFWDIEGTEAQLNYMQENVGGIILECYKFSSIDDFHKERMCYRFATTRHLRESILVTQSFVLGYILDHPKDCFDGPYFDNLPENESACDEQTKMEILSPILAEYTPFFQDYKARVDEELQWRGLIGERI